jgi:predicted ATPase
VLVLLTWLPDESLVVAETQGDEARFGLLDTVRHYARTRLRDSGEEESVRTGAPAHRRTGAPAHRRIGVPACWRAGVIGRSTRVTATKPRTASAVGVISCRTRDAFRCRVVIDSHPCHIG